MADKIVEKLSKLNYKNLPKMWLESKAQKPPEGFSDISDFSQEPYSMYMKPEDIWKYGNAISTNDVMGLYKNISPIPNPIDYPTIAFNMSNRLSELPAADVISSEYGTPMTTLGKTLSGMVNDYKGLPKREVKNIPQAIIAHERGHYYDPQRRPIKNKGFMSIMGEDPEIMMREIPAMIAEEEYWVKKGKSPRNLEALLALRKSINE